MLPCDSRGVETSLPLWLQSCHFYCYFCHFYYSIVENRVPTTTATTTITTQLNTIIQSCRYRPVLSPPTINRLPKSNTSINKVASTWYNSPSYSCSFVPIYLWPVLCQCNDCINEKIGHFVKRLYYFIINHIVLIGVLKEVWNCYLQTIKFTHH